MKKTFKRIFCLVLALTLLAGAVPAMAASYSDVSGHWAAQEINKWSDLGIIQGSEGRFRPDDHITRAEMAVLLDKLMGYRVKADNSFIDVPQTWYTDAILRANAAGIILGDGAGSMNPNNRITRQEAATMICRALNIEPYQGSTGFADDYSIAGWAKPYVNALSQKGLIDGVGNGYFAPQSNINRASAVKIIDNAVKTLINTGGSHTLSSSGTVLISSGDVQLSNTYISGDLIIAEGVGEGNVTLDGVTVSGSTIIKGGGTVTLSNCSIPSLTVNKLNGSPNVSVSGTTTVYQTRVLDSCKLSEASSISGQGFQNVTVDENKKSYLRIDMTGKFDSLRQNAYNADIRASGSIKDIQINAITSFEGNFSFDSIYVASGAGCTINGVPVSSGSGSELIGVTIAIPGSAGYARVGDTLSASTVSMGSTALSYQWYSYDRELIASDSKWQIISGATYKDYTVPSSMNGHYLMVEVRAGSTTLRAVLPSAVGSGVTGTGAISIENYDKTNSMKNEAAVRFIFSKPLAVKNASGSIVPVENNYDFKYSGSNWFSVKVNTNAPTLDDSLIASAIYSTSDRSLTVTLAGDATHASNRVELRFNQNLYDTDGKTLSVSSSPVAVRIANCSSWQNGGTNGNTGLDTTPPKASAAQTGHGASVLRISFDEPLGYKINGIVRPVNDGYDFMNIAGTLGLFSVKVDGLPTDGANHIASALYQASTRSVLVTIKAVNPDDSVTLAPLQPFYDLFGNELNPTKAGVFYRRADDVMWYKVDNQEIADAAARGEVLDGSPFIRGADGATHGTRLTAEMGTLNLTTGITFKWYRSDDVYFDDGDTLLTTGTSYTVTTADIGKHILLVASSGSLTGSRMASTGKIEKAVTTVRPKTATVNQVSDGRYDLSSISGLFDINSTGKRTYKLDSDFVKPGPEAASYGSARIENGILYADPTVSEYKIVVEVAESNLHKAYTPASGANGYAESEKATLRITTSIDRTISTNVKTAEVAQTTSIGDEGKVWLSATLNKEGHRLYVKNSTTSASSGENLTPGSYLGVGYTPLCDNSGNVVTSVGRSIEGSVQLGGDARDARAGSYFLVETDEYDRVVRTGVLRVTNDNIRARVQISNNRSEDITLSSYSLSISAGTTIDVYVPLSATTLSFNSPTGSHTKTISYSNCVSYVNIDDSANFK